MIGTTRPLTPLWVGAHALSFTAACALSLRAPAALSAVALAYGALRGRGVAFRSRIIFVAFADTCFRAFSQRAAP